MYLISASYSYSPVIELSFWESVFAFITSPNLWFAVTMILMACMLALKVINKGKKQ